VWFIQYIKKRKIIIELEMDTVVLNKDFWYDLRKRKIRNVNICPIYRSVFICLHTNW